ncbi:MAG TPA: hypothetical protein VFT10_10075 [Solirubrobacterales bacterium]|nr:hypothetical protein [Solirubrobacterales bacterium]
MLGSVFNSLDPWDAVAIGLVGFAFVAIYRLPGRVRSEVEGRLALGNVTGILGEIETAAGQAYERVEELEHNLTALVLSEGQKSFIQALAGTLIGLVGGLSADWIKGGELFPDGQLDRVLIVVFVGLAFIVIAPWLAVRVASLVIRAWAWAQGKLRQAWGS